MLDEYLPQEQDDALEVLAWLAAQPWCTGRVGIIGKSWGGFNGLQIAARRPPELAGVISVCSTDDRYATDVHYMGGCLLGADMLPWASTMLAYNARPPDPAVVGERWRELWLERLEGTPPFVAGLGRRTSAATRSGSTARCARTSTPSRCPSTWWAAGRTPTRTPSSASSSGYGGAAKGLVGPWGHLYPHSGAPGPAIGFLQECLRFWDHCLKGAAERCAGRAGAARVHAGVGRPDRAQARGAAGALGRRAVVAAARRPAAPRAASARRFGSRRAGRRRGRTDHRRLAVDRPATPGRGAAGAHRATSRATSGPRTGARSASPPSRWPSGWRSSASPRRSSRSPPTGRSRSCAVRALRRRAVGLVAARDPGPPQPHAPRLARGARAARAGAPLRGRRATGRDRARVCAGPSPPRLRLADVLAVRVAQPGARHAHARRRGGEPAPAARCAPRAPRTTPCRRSRSRRSLRRSPSSASAAGSARVAS